MERMLKMKRNKGKLLLKRGRGKIERNKKWKGMKVKRNKARNNEGQRDTYQNEMKSTNQKYL